MNNPVKNLRHLVKKSNNTTGDYPERLLSILEETKRISQESRKEVEAGRMPILIFQEVQTITKRLENGVNWRLSLQGETQ